MKFNTLVNKVTEALKTGNVDAARELLDAAWKHAKAAHERKRAHDLGNVIQREIFAQYGLV